MNTLYFDISVKEEATLFDSQLKSLLNFNLESKEYFYDIHIKTDNNKVVLEFEKTLKGNHFKGFEWVEEEDLGPGPIPPPDFDEELAWN